MPLRDQLARIWLGCAVCAVLIFTIFPRTDLAVSRTFWDGASFPAATVPIIEGLRQGLWSLSLVVALVAGIGLARAGLIAGPRQRNQIRPWAFLVTLYLAGPGLVVNLVLKGHWGRARPDQIDAFSGTRAFTPPLWPADQCSGNCSFVSGEAASAMALAVAVVFLTQWLRPSALRPAICLAIAIAGLGGGLRLMAGRHFLSDIVFAWLIVGGLALLLDWVILRGGIWTLLPRPSTSAVAAALERT